MPRKNHKRTSTFQLPSPKSSCSNFCRSCNLKFPTAKALSRHMQENGPPCDTTMVQCDYCNTYWPNTISLQRHWERNNSCNSQYRKPDHENTLCRPLTLSESKTRVSVEQNVRSTIPSFARNELARFADSFGGLNRGKISNSERGIQNDSNGSTSIIKESQYRPSKTFAYSDLTCAKNNVDKSLPVGSSEKRNMRSSVILDDITTKHLKGIMQELGFGGLLTTDSSGLPFKPSEISQMPSIEKLTEMIRERLNDPMSSCYRAVEEATESQSPSMSLVGAGTSMVMDTFYLSEDGMDTSEEEEEDQMIDITEDEVVEFIHSHVNLTDNDDSLEYADEGENDDEFVLVHDNIEDDNEDALIVPNAAPGSLYSVKIYQQYIQEYRKKQIYRDRDRANIELFDLLAKCRAPKYLFDEIQQWTEKNSSVISNSQVSTREQLVKSLESKIHGEYAKDMRPRVQVIALSSGRKTGITTFSFRMGLMSKLNDPNLMKPENLLLDCDDPYSMPIISDSYYGEVNTGHWYRNAHRRLCRNPRKDVLIPIGLFIDGANGDKHGNHVIEPIVAVPLIFKRSIRNLAESWFTIGYVESLKGLSPETEVVNEVAQDLDGTGFKTMKPIDKLQDYHDITKHILQELIGIQNQGGFELTLKIGDKSFDAVAKVPVQFIIGDCKGNDYLCGRFGSHRRNVKHLVRDCDVLTEDGDNPNHVCRFISAAEVESWDEKECRNMSFHKIRNAYSLLDFGGDRDGIYGAVPPEPLHVFQMGLCIYLVQEFLRDNYGSTKKILDKAVIEIVAHHSRQSHRGFPILSTFRNGFDSLGTISGKEKYARIFVLYLALMKSEVIHSIATARGSGCEYPPIGLERAMNWLRLVESSLGFMEWMRLKRHPKHTIDDPEDSDSESPAQEAMRDYLNLFKQVVNRQTGNGLKLVKFHHPLHFVRYIRKHGTIPNFDGSRNESMAKTNTKNKFALTQKRSATENYQTACRLYEAEVVKEASNVIHDRLRSLHGMSLNDSMETGYLSSDDEGCSDIENDESNSTMQHGLVKGSKFLILFDYTEDSDEVSLNTVNDDRHSCVVNVVWQRTEATVPIDQKILSCLARRLFLNTGEGGCLLPSSRVIGFTEYKVGGALYRCHPSYRSGKPWRDWAMLRWEVYEDSVPAKIMMFLDLREAKLMTRAQHKRFINDKDPELPEEDWSSGSSSSNSDDESEESETGYLDNGLWCIVQTARSPRAEERHFSRYHLSSRIATRVILEDNLRVLPIESIDGPCFVVTEDSKPGNDQLAFVLDDTSMWCDKTFL